MKRFKPGVSYADVLYIVSIANQELNTYKRLLGTEVRRRKQLVYTAVFFTALALFGFFSEATIIAVALSGLGFDVLGTFVTGIMFITIVPVVMALYHIRTHRNGDKGLKKFVSRAAMIGILVIVFGISGLIGFSFMGGALESLGGNESGGFAGTDGDQTITPENEFAGWSSIISGLIGLPIILFGLALCFSMVIAMELVSFCVGKVLEALNVIMLTENRAEKLDKCDEIRQTCRNLHAKALELQTAHSKLPSDPKLAFARAYFDLVCEQVRPWHTAIYRVFRSHHPSNYVTRLEPEFDLDFVKEQFADADSAKKHLAELVDHARVHNTLKTLEGNPGTAVIGEDYYV